MRRKDLLSSAVGLALTVYGVRGISSSIEKASAFSSPVPEPPNPTQPISGDDEYRLHYDIINALPAAPGEVVRIPQPADETPDAKSGEDSQSGRENQPNTGGPGHVRIKETGDELVHNNLIVHCAREAWLSRFGAIMLEEEKGRTREMVLGVLANGIFTDPLGKTWNRSDLEIIGGGTVDPKNSTVTLNPPGWYKNPRENVGKRWMLVVSDENGKTVPARDSEGNMIAYLVPGMNEAWPDCR